jgi:hypothetical protein
MRWRCPCLLTTCHRRTASWQLRKCNSPRRHLSAVHGHSPRAKPFQGAPLRDFSSFMSESAFTAECVARRCTVSFTNLRPVSRAGAASVGSGSSSWPTLNKLKTLIHETWKQIPPLGVNILVHVVAFILVSEDRSRRDRISWLFSTMKLALSRKPLHAGFDIPIIRNYAWLQSSSASQLLWTVAQRRLDVWDEHDRPRRKSLALSRMAILATDLRSK